MSKIALIVEFEIKPESRAAFIELMRGHAEGTLADEDGCLQFDVLLPTEGNGRVFLYEVYRDEAALQEHTQSGRLAATREGYADMIEGRTIHVCTVG
ncbi:MAG: putative quinol monooxygenase [Alphaproteobacteria bacterium]|jgi:quinol monooxygenase YgiN|nr:putative quinol monooxygenase [Alphaproteobacteria bacterium]